MAKAEILEALASDARLAVVGFLLVIFSVAGMTKSTLLTSAAFLCMLLSLPLAYWMYRQVSCTCKILVGIAKLPHFLIGAWVMGSPLQLGAPNRAHAATQLLWSLRHYRDWVRWHISHHKHLL